MFGRLAAFFLCASIMGEFYSIAASEHCPRCVAQTIFDEESPTETESREEKTEASSEQPKSTAEASEATDSSKGKKKKKKKSRRKRKQAEPEALGSTTAMPEYSPQELARQSYAWAPESDFKLKSSAPGLKPTVLPAAVPTTPPTTALEGQQPQSPGFKLPQIPLTQVLIVGAFVVLFLLYRLQVGRQLKRRKY